LEAFLKKRMASTLPLFYFGVCPDQSVVEFLKSYRIMSLAVELEAQ
jgi:hypothetical protein